jgi:hypothetical protein
MIAMGLIAGLIVASSNVYVNGWGWANARDVGYCLGVVGANHEDELSDGRWEDFTDCLSE